MGTPINSINVNHPAMEQALDYIRTAHNNLVTEHDDLKRFLLNLQGDWQGKGGESWATAQNNWDTSADAVYDVLRQLMVALGDIHYNYMTTDSQLSSQWSG